MEYDDVMRYVERFSVNLTGARAGDVVTGTNSISGTAVMKIVRGNVPPLKTDIDAIRQFPELWVIFLNKLATLAFFKAMTIAERDTWMSENAIEGDIDLAEVGVKTDHEQVYVEVVDAGDGKFTELLEEEVLTEILAGNPDDETGAWSLMDLRNKFPFKVGSKGLLGRSTLIFYMHFWKIAVMYDVVSETKSMTYSLISGKITKGAKADEGTEIIYLKNSLEKKDGKQDFAIVVNKSKKVDYWNVLKQKVSSDLVTTVKTATSNFTPAGFKSLLQKIIRLAPYHVKFGKKKLNATDVLFVVFTLLMTSPGSFVPDIQRFVSGQESAFKRLVVTVLEDSYIDSDSMMLKLLVMAFLSQRTKWTPTAEEFLDALNVCEEALDRRAIYKHGIQKGFEMERYYFGVSSTPLENVSAMLDTLRSFQTDLAMTRYIAGFKKRVDSDLPRPDVMGLEHCIDHHWAPEVIYMLPSAQVEKYIDVGTKPFLDVMKNVFMRVTGVNSRKTGTGLSEHKLDPDPSFVKAVVRGQKMVLRAKQHDVKRMQLRKEEPYVVDVELSQSWIAGLVGQIEVKGKPPALLTLNPYDPYEMIPIRKPSRGVKDGTLTDERTEAVKLEVMKVMRLGGYLMNKSTAPLPHLQDVRIRLDEDDKYVFVKEGKRYNWGELSTAKIPVEWLLKKPKLTLWNTIKYTGNGMYHHAFSRLRKLLRQYDIRSLRRLLSYVSSHRSEIEIARLSKDGGGVTSAVVFEDVDACHLMLMFTLLFPAAVQRVKGYVSKFKLVIAPLFWQITDIVREVALAVSDQCEPVQWVVPKDTSGRIARSYQLDVLEEMVEKKKKGHFIWIPVGMGKTYIVLSYLRHLIMKTCMSKYVIYTLPKSAIKSIIVEIQHFGIPINLMVPIQSWKKHPEVQHIKKFDGPLPGHINLVDHDHLRRMDEVLLQTASDSIVVIDEVHKALNDTKRTSLALELSRLSVNFVALTGTPIVDSNTYKLIWWLEQLVDFEVNEKNFWVAANAMLARRVKTDVEISRKSVLAPMTDKEQREYNKLVPPTLGGESSHPTSKDIQQAFELSYNVADRTIVSETMGFLKRDIGVMVVARNAKHQAKLYAMLIAAGMKERDIFSLGPSDSVFMTDDSVATGMTPDYKVVIVPLQKSEGYTLTRLGAMVTGVYPSNEATRTQLAGRINRISQRRKKIYYRTVHTGILTYVMQKHASAASLTAVLTALAKEVELEE